MPTDSELQVVLVYPDLLGTYGDRGNALVLAYRARARGIPARVIAVTDGQPVPTTGDLYLLGGSEDATQLQALALLRRQPGLRERLRAGPCLAVCAGFQILARDFHGADGRSVEGLGVFDASCGRLAGVRAVGEVVADGVGVPGLPPLSGYENHQGDATLDAGVPPLGRVRVGVGNGVTGPDGAVVDGAVQGGAVGTYLHGPVLVRNPALADHLLARVTGALAPLEHEAVTALRRERLHAAAHDASRRPGPRRARRGLPRPDVAS